MIDPDFALPYNNRVFVYFTKGDALLAAIDFAAALRFAPNTPDVRY
ncbi:MAG: hypothetical protein LBC76_10680 [Treponema sp.]|nr:hypothetical protein [Treponema sp.]